MFKADRATAATSKHKAQPCFEWSKQISRDVHPFFVPAPIDNQRGTYGAEKPQRHRLNLDLDKSLGRETRPPKEDPRDYQPKTYSDFHPKCGVNIGKSTRGKDIFSCEAQPTTVLEPHRLDDGWGHGKKSAMPRAAKPKDAVDKLREEAERWQAEHGAAPPPSSAHNSSLFVESRIKKPQGGAFARHDGRATAPYPDRPALKLNYNSVSKHQSNVSLQRGAPRLRKEKSSDKYRELFRTPPPPPLYSHDRMRTTKGFAPMRSSSSMSVSDLLANADADLKRARSSMESTFGQRSRSELRSTMLYTPSFDDDGDHDAGHAQAISAGADHE